MTELDFLEKNIFPQNGPKFIKNRFLLKLLKNVVINFFYIRFISMAYVYYLPLQNMAREIYADMLSTYQITGFLNQLNLFTELMN